MSFPERRQTDESLRLEREHADLHVAEKLKAIDQTADDVIRQARARADELLAGTRAKTDQQWATPAPAQHPGLLVMQRLLEDNALRAERAEADDRVRRERAEHVARQPLERVDTDKDLLSERARADDDLATRDEFLALVSHDLRNMLHGLTGFAALIEEDVQGNRPDQVVTYAQRIQRSAARMNHLIGDLVDIASIDAGRLAVARVDGDPAVVIAEAVETFQKLAAGRGVSLVTEIVSPIPRLAFDPARILQVLINLLSNAVKFTPSDGKVVVRLEQVGSNLQFSLRDNGVGIPADKLEAVFERFLQVTLNDRRGQGLGLYISKCIVQGHGGRIWAESTLGSGSNFCFTLPLGPSPWR